MYEIVLALAKKEKVISLKRLMKETGLSKEKVLKALFFWSSRGKLVYMSNLKSRSCTNCPLANVCKLRR